MEWVAGLGAAFGLVGPAELAAAPLDPGGLFCCFGLTTSSARSTCAGGVFTDAHVHEKGCVSFFRSKRSAFKFVHFYEKCF